ncbi:MAG TPA: hypothetical protein PK379_11200 [Candidatus Hydrogenedentes bacterium]|nr:hypothetical protein [Candidatus Hydrogenedentota bacterium]HOK90580.1 hypothetical protein [Candidatus Hydrogenedentota bacterium]
MPVIARDDEAPGSAPWMMKPQGMLNSGWQGDLPVYEQLPRGMFSGISSLQRETGPSASR